VSNGAAPALVPSRLALGLAALGRPAYLTTFHAEALGADRSVEGLRRRAHEVLDAAWAAGLRHVDAARSYGRAEEFLASWLSLRAIAPREIGVSSKWGYRYVGGWRTDLPPGAPHEVKDHSVAALAEQLAESRGILGPFLGLYQIHSATAESGVLGDGAVLDALARVRDDGLPVGLSVSGPSQADTVLRAIAARRGGERLFSAVQATWNLVERSCEAALAEAHAEGIRVMVKEPLANGRLAPGGDLAPALLDAARAAGLGGAGPDALALAAALSRPWAGLVLLGAASVAQLASNLGALRVEAGETSAIVAATVALAEPPLHYWRRRAATRWT
jgi:aryl-alcohol dehydrogenase-like predicted oxidoreductase